MATVRMGKGVAGGGTPEGSELEREPEEQPLQAANRN